MNIKEFLGMNEICWDLRKYCGGNFVHNSFPHYDQRVHVSYIVFARHEVFFYMTALWIRLEVRDSWWSALRIWEISERKNKMRNF